MGQQHYGAGSSTHMLSPDDDWLTVNASVTTLVNDWSYRSDLVAILSPEGGRGKAAALFDPYLLQVEINTKEAFGETLPEDVGDLTHRNEQFMFPKASGAIYHEACHARHTTFDLKAANDALTPKQMDALMLLEESRIEKMGIIDRPENKPFLRACALDIVLKDTDTEEFRKMDSIRQAAHLSALSLARVDGGSLKKRDVRQFGEPLRRVLGDELLQKFRNIWLEFQGLTSPKHHIDRMYDLAKKWAELLDEAAKDQDKAQQDAADQMMKEIMKQLGQSASEAEVSAQGDAQEQQMAEKQEAENKERREKAKERQNGKNAADEVFKKLRASFQHGGQLEYKDTRTGVVSERPPTGEERQAAITVGRALEKAKYHDRVRIETSSVLPPGRLKSGAAVQAAAYRSQNIYGIESQPWRRVQRKHEVDPNLTLGIMVDSSGSMSGACEPMAVSAWVMNEACRRIQAKMAYVRYGHAVLPVLAKGQHMRDVTIFSAPDGSEAFSYGFSALDGELDLLNGTGARLLVVVSDGNYKSNEIEECSRILRRCDQEGVAVLWLGYGSSGAARDQCSQTATSEFIVPEGTPAGVARQVGEAAVKALNRAGSSARR